MIEEHLESLRQSGQYSRVTVRLATGWLLRFQSHCGDKSPLEMSPNDLLNWQRQLAWSPNSTGKLYSENTLNQAVGAVRRFYRWAIAEGLLKSDPTKRLVTRAVKNATSFKLHLSSSETRKLLSSPDLATPVGMRNRAVFGILLETKISRRACSQLDHGDLQFDTGALLSRGRRQQIHSLSNGLLADLERYLREARPLLIQSPHPALFLTRDGGRLSQASIQQTLRRHRQLCGL